MLELLALPGRPAAPPALTAPSEAARALLALLERAPATRDELLRSLSAPDGSAPRGLAAAERLAPALLELELAGRIARDRDGRFRIVA
jgi:hypothetical protein